MVAHSDSLPVGTQAAAALAASEKGETPSPFNPLGAKGCSETGAIGSTPAIVNAVVDALASFGLTHLDMPLTLARVWEAIQQARSQRRS